MNEQQLVDKWIKELEDAGFTPNGIIKVFRLANKKWQQMKAEPQYLANFVVIQLKSRNPGKRAMGIFFEIRGTQGERIPCSGRYDKWREYLSYGAN